MTARTPHLRRLAPVAVALLLGAATTASGQPGTVAIEATPSPFGSGATISITAEASPGTYPGWCSYWDHNTHSGCLVIGPAWAQVTVEGSNGFSPPTEYAQGSDMVTLVTSDPGPGQTMQPVTYTASGVVVWELCTSGYYNPPVYECWTSEYDWEEEGEAQATVIPAVVPSADWVSPSSGAGPSQTFTFQYSSTAGAGDIHQTWQIFNPGGYTATSCVVGVYALTSTLVLWNDAGTGETSAPLGAPVVLKNSQCRVSVAGASQSVNGNLRTVVLPITFRPAYHGPHNVYASGMNGGGTYGPWLDIGDWIARAQVDAVWPTTARVGETIQVSGAGFGAAQGGNGLRVNGIVATVEAWSDTLIRAQVPAGATTGPVDVVTNGQASNTTSLTITAGPHLASLSKTWGPTGTVITLTGTGFGTRVSGDHVKFYNNKNGSITSWTNTTIAVMKFCGLRKPPALRLMLMIIVDGDKRISLAAYHAILGLSEGLVAVDHMPKDLEAHVDRSE